MIKDFIYTLFGWKRYYILSYTYKDCDGSFGSGRAIITTRGKLGNIVHLEKALEKECNSETAAINGIFEIRKDQAI